MKTAKTSAFAKYYNKRHKARKTNIKDIREIVLGIMHKLEKSGPIVIHQKIIGVPQTREFKCKFTDQ